MEILTFHKVLKQILNSKYETSCGNFYHGRLFRKRSTEYNQSSDKSVRPETNAASKFIGNFRDQAYSISKDRRINVDLRCKQAPTPHAK